MQAKRHVVDMEQGLMRVGEPRGLLVKSGRGWHAGAAVTVNGSRATMELCETSRSAPRNLFVGGARTIFWYVPSICNVPAPLKILYTTSILALENSRV